MGCSVSDDAAGERIYLDPGGLGRSKTGQGAAPKPAKPESQTHGLLPSAIGGARRPLAQRCACPSGVAWSPPIAPP